MFYRNHLLLNFSEAGSRTSSSPSEDTDSANHEMWVKLMTSENDKSHGSLFLRIGAIAFGLGTLIYTGLEFLSFFEIPKTCGQWSVLLGVNPILYMIFVFMQVIEMEAKRWPEMSIL